MTGASKRSASRSHAITRSRRVLDRASRQFRTTPSDATRRAVELSTHALQLADLLSENPGHNQEGQFRQWEDAWLAAHLAMYRISRQLREQPTR
jgi:hypothetical protein